MSEYRGTQTVSQRPEKGEPYRLSSTVAHGLEENLRSVTAGHFPVYDGDRIIGVFVGVDRFNILQHLADMLDDTRMISATSANQADEHHLSFEEVFDR
jgi:hypothetical protein